MVDGLARYVEKQSSGVDATIILSPSSIDSKSCLKKSISLLVALLIRHSGSM